MSALKNTPLLLFLALAYCFLLSHCTSDAPSENARKPSKQEKSQSQTNTPVPNNTGALLSLISPEQSGIQFVNVLKETNDMNSFNYEYLYNGSGIAVGDINNDNLPDLLFGGNLVPVQLYLNKGNLQFENISQSAGVISRGFTTGVSMIDINQDGLLDIYLCRSLSSVAADRENVLLINNGDLTFSNQAKQYNLADTGFSNQAVFFDMDQDQDLDVFVLNHRTDFKMANTYNVSYDKATQTYRQNLEFSQANKDRLYENRNNQFVDISDKAGIKNPAYGFSAGLLDANNDGWMDLYVCNDYVDKDYLYINQKNKTFSDELDRYIGNTSLNSMGNDVADFNNDGLFDLISLDMIPEGNHRQKTLKGMSPYDKFHQVAEYGGHYQIMRNALHLNTGQGGFQEIGQLANISHTDWSWTPLFVDLDNDGWKDLLITNGYFRDVTSLDFMKYGKQEITQKAGGPGKVSKLAVLEEIPQVKSPNYAFKNQGNLTFKNVSKEWGFGHSAFSNGMVYADLDLDGDLEILVNNINDKAFLFKNNSQEKLNQNYLRVKLIDSKNKNNYGLGAKVSLKAGDLKITEQMQVMRGYFSSVEPILHFGLGKASRVDSLIIEWGPNERQILTDVAINQVLNIDKKITHRSSNKTQKIKELIPSIKQKKGIDFKHREDKFIDFKREPLLPHKFSNKGPYFTKGDINGDGLEDFFVGGAIGQKGTVYLQSSNGSFSKKAQPDFTQDLSKEDEGALFFDADQDGDLDLYVVSGGNAFAENDERYQDRLYLNNGKGNLKKSSEALPPIQANGSVVQAIDFDQDGDLDLFVGGRVVPGSYPLSPQSYLLQNEGGKFTDVSNLLPKEGKLGMINDVAVASLKAGTAPQIILAGEWMPITVLGYDGSKFVDQSSNYQLSNSKGWWTCLAIQDLNNDGQADILAGNRGLNSFYKAKSSQPAQIYAGDFDNNGSIDALPTYYYSDGKSHPKHTRDEIFQQIPFVRSKFPRYSDYANAGIRDILSPEQLNKALVLEANTFASTLFLSNGSGQYKAQELPIEAQVAPIQDFYLEDLNKDGLIDILAVGNNYGVEVEIGRYDAMKGVCLKGQSNGKFETVPIGESGFYVPEEGRQIMGLATKNGKLIVVSNNNDAPLLFQQ